MAATQTRILEAATAEYARNGIENTSMQAVARRADVAAGTVLYHYPSPDDLARAAVAHWMEIIEPPVTTAIDPDTPLETRVSDLVTALFQFYDRSDWAYQISRRSPDNPVLAEARAGWDETFEALIARALGDDVRNAESTRLVSVLVDAGFYGLLRSSGYSSGDATEVARRLIINSVSGP